MTEQRTSQPSHVDVPLPLERRQILDWGGAFGVDGKALWADSARLAARFWATPEGHNRQVAWHHLLMAVGNFKRQTPIHVGECLVDLPDASSDPPAELVLPGGPRLGRDEAATWKALTDVPGLGVATATTLLSALWPGKHVIIDRRAWAAAVGLRASEGFTSRRVAPEDGRRLPEITWEDYDEYLPWVRATASKHGVDLRDLERTLYQLPRNVPEAESRSWKEYGDLLRARRPFD